MTDPSGSIVYRRWRAPRQDGQALLDPPMGVFAHQAQQQFSSIRLRDPSPWSLSGMSLAEVRAAFLRNAVEHTSGYLPGPHCSRGTESPILLTGHQPHLFHPGVWFKNFVVSQLADRINATAVHLIIDNDLSAEARVPILSGDPDDPQRHWMDLDAPSPALPYEERKINQVSTLDSFDARVVARLTPLVTDPIVVPLWQNVREARMRQTLLGGCLSEARHRMEFAWGLQLLYVPLSSVCDGDAFAGFLGYLASHAARFRADL